MTSHEAPSPDAADDALARHRQAVEAGLPSDPEEVKRLYKELGDHFFELHGEDQSDVPVLSFPETAPVVTALVSGRRGAVLDAGCGPNPSILMGLGHQDRFLVGLDLGEGSLRVGRALAAQRGVTIHPVVGDVEHLPFRTAAFAGVVCDDTIEHLPDDAAGVSELARVTSLDGRAVLATPNRHSLEIVARKARDRLRGVRRPRSDYFVATSHLREYTWTEFEHLVRPVFQITRRAAVGWTGGWKKRLASTLTALPGFRRGDQMIVIEVRPR